MIRLDHVLQGQVSSVDNSTKVSGQGSKGQAVSAPATGDATRLSTTSGIVAQATAGSDVRFEKVAALQSAIASGTYKVSAGDVADKLINSLLDGR